MVRTSPSVPRAQVQSLVGELRSHKLHGMSQGGWERLFISNTRSEQSENEIKKQFHLQYHQKEYNNQEYI